MREQMIAMTLIDLRTAPHAFDVFISSGTVRDGLKLAGQIGQTKVVITGSCAANLRKT